MLIIKALTKMLEDWSDDGDDFYIYYHIDIGPEEIHGTSDLFSFELISPKRLQRMTHEGDIIIGRGCIITGDFNEKKLEETVNRIVSKCSHTDITKANYNLSRYFRWEMDE